MRQLLGHAEQAHGRNWLDQDNAVENQVPKSKDSSKLRNSFRVRQAFLHSEDQRLAYGGDVGKFAAVVDSKPCELP